MSKNVAKSNIIEINGRRYDAHTGQLLDGRKSDAASASAKPVNDAASAVSQPATRSVPVHVATTVKAVPKPSQTAKVRVHDAVKARSQTRQQQRSKTLMRAAVTKPSHNPKRRIKVHNYVASLTDKPAARLQPKASIYQVDKRRLEHAHAIARSQSVSRFGRPHPALEDDLPIQLPARQPKPREFPISHLQPQSEPSKPDALDTISVMLETALQHATSHLEPAPVIKKRRLFRFASD